MSVRNIAAHVLGFLSIAAAVAWATIDVRADAHLDKQTAYGALLLGVLGGWLIDKDATRAFVKFFAEQAKAVVGVFLPNAAGSDSEK